MLLKILNYFFVGLGVVFLLLLLTGTYLYIVDPFNVRPMLEYWQSATATNMPQQEETSESSEELPELSPAQEQALEAAGIDPAQLTQLINPTQETCFVDVLGETRVAEIKAGAAPTPAEFFAARHCLE